MSGRLIPFRQPSREPDDAGGFEEVTRARDQAEALVVKSLLEAYGIRVLLRTHVAQSVHPFTVGDQGEVVVLVAEPDAPRARVLMARVSPGPS